MRTLFGKILLWFLGAMALTIAAVVGTTALTLNSGEQHPRPAPGLIRYQIREAIQAYETGGPPALEAVLQRLDAAYPGRHILTDTKGRDLVKGSDYSKYLTESRNRSAIPFSPPRVFARPTQDERYWFLLVLTRRESTFWFLQPWHLWIIGLIMLLSYLMARHLAKPVRTLRHAVDRFGRGDLTARAPVRGSDEVGRLAATFNQMGDRIETLVTAQRRLLQDISHELRSPLARLNVAIELARSAPDPEPSLDRIQKEADRLNELVGELIEVTRAEGDPARRRTQTVRLDEIVTQVVHDSEIEASALGCRLDYAVPPPITTQGDGELLRRAVENIVRNAIRHAPPDTSVEVRATEDRGGAHIRVRDYGSGVPEEALPLLFEPFYRVESDRGRNSGGVGLGLAIVRRAVELHKGTVRATNVDPGLAVEIVIPVPPKAPAAPATEAHPVGAHPPL